jgi:Ni/Co efflux regulator RcnB
VEGGQRGQGPGDHAGPPLGGIHGHDGHDPQPGVRAPGSVDHRDRDHDRDHEHDRDHQHDHDHDHDRDHDRGHDHDHDHDHDRDGFGGPRGAPRHWEEGHFPSVFESRERFRGGYYRPPYGYYSRAWGFGDFLPRPWFAQDYWMDNFLDFDLPYPPPGFVWVRVGPDVLLLDRFTGRIVQVVRGIFW